MKYEINYNTLYNLLEDKFYIQNLSGNRREIEKKAIENIINRCQYDINTLFRIENYDEIGIVEFVAENKFDIIDDYIIRED